MAVGEGEGDDDTGKRKKQATQRCGRASHAEHVHRATTKQQTPYLVEKLRIHDNPPTALAFSVLEPREVRCCARGKTAVPGSGRATTSHFPLSPCKRPEPWSATTDSQSPGRRDSTDTRRQCEQLPCSAACRVPEARECGVKPHIRAQLDCPSSAQLCDPPLSIRSGQGRPEPRVDSEARQERARNDRQQSQLTRCIDSMLRWRRYAHASSPSPRRRTHGLQIRKSCAACRAPLNE
jgi:hypothetical protein